MAMQPFERTDSVFHAFSSVSDDEWLRILISSLSTPEIQGVSMPLFPTSDLQREIHGHADEVSLHEAHIFYREIKAYCAYVGRDIHSRTAFLDFGSGWGRIARLFMKDIKPCFLYNFESTDRFLIAARRANPFLCFQQSGLVPPLPIQSKSLDVITSWSFFAHADEFLAGHWMREFHRILRPDGLLVVTTQSRRFLAFCAEQRIKRASGMRLEHPWHEVCADSFVNEKKANDDFDLGKFLYAGSSKAPHAHSHYGEAIIPKNYIIKAWGGLFRLVEYLDNPVRLPQVLIVLQKIG